MLPSIVEPGIRITISGRVQGVGFRHFIWRRARELGLAGEVRNLPLGGVEVKARGAAHLLEQLVSHARQGPSHAQVADVRIEDLDEVLPPVFRIRD
jgi:acylphosphatase